MDHTPQHTGSNDWQENVSDIHEATRDFKVKVEHIMAEGDWVMVHFSSSAKHHGRSVTHKHLRHRGPTSDELKSSGINLLRFENGKIVEAWFYDDSHKFAGEAGAIPGA